MAACGGALRVFVHLVHRDEHALAVDGIVQGFGGLRSAGIMVGIFQVEPGFHLRALGQALPVAAELVVEQIEGGARGKRRVGVELHHALQFALIKLRAEVGLLLMRAGQSADVGLVELPADVGGAKSGFGRERRVGKVLTDAPVEQMGGRCGVLGRMRLLGLRFEIGGRAVEQQVAIGGGGADDAFVADPAGAGVGVGVRGRWNSGLESGSASSLVSVLAKTLTQGPLRWLITISWPGVTVVMGGSAGSALT